MAARGEEDRPRVAVIGAGVSGLTAIKSCLEEGLLPVCFEQFDTIGGCWKYTDQALAGEGAKVYESLVAIDCKQMLCFSDFPPPRNDPMFTTHRNFMNYLDAYTSHSGLQKYIRFRHQVTEITPTLDHDVTGKWQVGYQAVDSPDEEPKSQQTEVFDKVMVCSGLNRKPKYPNIKGFSNFQNEVLHSLTYRKSDIFKGKNVLVIGNATSACDIAPEASKVAKQVYLSVGRGTWALPRFMEGGIPLDMHLFTRKMMIAPGFLFARTLARMSNSFMDPAVYGLQPPNAAFQGPFAINDQIRTVIATGKVVIKPGVSSFTEKGAVFEDQTSLDNIDLVLFATGYRHEFRFLSKSIVPDAYEDLQLYRLTFPTCIKQHTLALVGFAFILGPNPPSFELQARWIARVFSGHCKLPSEEQMSKEIQNRKEIATQIFGDPRLMTGFLQFGNEIAEELGVALSFWKLLFTDPKLAFTVFLGPAFAVHHRLVGPHAWAGARAAALSAYDNALAGARTKQVTQKPCCRKSTWLLLVTGIVGLASIYLYWL